MAENLGPDVPPSLYYAMGVQYTENFGRDEQPYLYNGKEFISQFGLNEYDSQARYYYPVIGRTTTMDPHAENRYHISPYAWCSNNPINRIDLDGLDDEFDKEGRYLRHIDNGTDFVMVQNANGEFQNITEFSYCEEDLANRAMLSNVMTYYGKQVGLDQKVGLSDNPTAGEDASFLTGTKSRQINIVVNDGRIKEDNSTSNNIMNMLVHEGDHAAKGVSGPMAEIEAIIKQISHPTWGKTTDSFKEKIMSYLANNANAVYPYNPTVESTIAPIMQILNDSPYSIFFYDGAYSIFLNNTR